jgi:chromosome segregation ATPase
MADKPLIETGVDKLVALVNERTKISIPDASKELSVPKVVIEEWANFLEEKGIIDVSYKFATPYLVKRGVTKKDIQKKTKDFKEHREGFLRKIETTLSVIEKETAGLKDLKKSFEDVGKEVEEKVKAVQTDLDKLKEYERLKKEADNQIKEEQKKCQERLQNLDERVSEKQRFYKVLTEKIAGEELKLGEEKDRTSKLKAEQLEMIKRIDDIRKAIPLLESAMKIEEKVVDEEEDHISHLKKEATQLKSEIAASSKLIQNFVKTSEESSKRMEYIQVKILEKMKKESERTKTVEEDSSAIKLKFENFFNKKMQIDVLLDKINTDVEKLEGELLKLVDEATIIEMSMEAGTAKERIGELDKKYKEILKKKKVFEDEILKLYDIVKK